MSPVQSLTKHAEFFVDAPNGALPGFFFVKIGIYRIDTYLGHPLKLKKVWANVILGDLIPVMPMDSWPSSVIVKTDEK